MDIYIIRHTLYGIALFDFDKYSGGRGLNIHSLKRACVKKAGSVFCHLPHSRHIRIYGVVKACSGPLEPCRNTVFLSVKGDLSRVIAAYIGAHDHIPVGDPAGIAFSDPGSDRKI